MIKLVEICPRRIEFGEYCLELAGVTVHFLFEERSTTQMFFEARHRGKPLGGQYSAQFHKAHIPSTQDHLHLYVKQNQLAALNRDGTAHDRSHGVQLPNRLVAAIQAEFPDFVIPANGLIESAPQEVQRDYDLIFD